VRDAELLPLYRKAGILYVLMGIESTDPTVLQRVNKDSTPEQDVQACRLLKEHGIFSVLGHIVGFEDETPESLQATRRRLKRYEGDWMNAMYVTPHDWTPFGRESLRREVVEPDQTKWDYRHQVLGQRHLRPWQLFLGKSVAPGRLVTTKRRFVPRSLASALATTQRARGHVPT
jgi:anaerobic magnesium-protoporphyrin IX monomethyl ester cyclase